MRWSFNTEIAGVYYRRQKLESGTFDGYIRDEPNNPYDSEAIGVYMSDNTLVGYIPKDQKYFLKVWNSDYNNLKGEIYLNIEKEWDRYSGSITLKSSRTYGTTNPMRDKKVYICKDITNDWGYDFYSIGETFGIIYNTQLKLDTDFVVYEGSVPKMVMDKKESERYHFELLSITEFIKKGINQVECDPSFYGKTIYVKGKRGGSYAHHIYNYILENGGSMTDRFSKKCDIALNWNDGFAPSVQERISKYGVPVISASSILKEPATNVPSSSINISSFSTANDRRSPKEADDKKGNKDVQFNSNLVLAIILGIAILLSAFVLLLK